MDPRLVQIANELGIDPSSIDLILEADDADDEPLTGELSHWVDPESGAQHWKRDHYYHRDGGLPALVDPARGSLMWYQDGKLHRDGDLPALMNGVVVSWYRYGKLHRDGDQPALIALGSSNGPEFLRDEDGDPFTPTIDITAGGMFWYRDGVLHRNDDRPAIVLNDGRCWDAVDGKLTARPNLY